jgi:phosphohistidine phosphatase
MKRLLILRHGKSDWSGSGVTDFDRPLARRGIKAAGRIGDFVRSQGLVPEFCLCSSAVRARQTWELVAERLRRPVAVEYRDDLYLADSEAMKSILHGTPPSCDALVVVGHEPGIGMLAGDLVGDGEVAATEASGGKYPTAGLAIMSFDIERWTELADGTGYLTHFIRPRRLRGTRVDAPDPDGNTEVGA